MGQTTSVQSQFSPTCLGEERGISLFVHASMNETPGPCFSERCQQPIYVERPFPKGNMIEVQ